MAMIAVSFFLRRTRSSQKDARLQKLLSVFRFLCGGEENFFVFSLLFFGCFFIGCKNLFVGTPDGRFSRFFLFFFERSA